MPEDRYKFTFDTAINHLDEIRKLFKEVTGSDYTLKIAKRGDFDPRNEINAFTLPKVENSATEENKTPASEKNRDLENVGDKFNQFFEKFSDIITDGDRQALVSGEDIIRGEQSVFSDEDNEDDKEEFLEESELSNDEEEDSL